MRRGELFQTAAKTRVDTVRIWVDSFIYVLFPQLLPVLSKSSRKQPPVSTG
ncbi:hypothetical protein VTG60DRAFT_6978 [Thermothelomyces hinnuleus]